MFFYVHQSHRHDSTHPSLFMSWGALWEHLVCSYDISHSRTWQVSIRSLADTNVSQTIAHPSTNQAQSCLTPVIRPQMVAPGQRGSTDIMLYFWLYNDKNSFIVDHRFIASKFTNASQFCLHSCAGKWLYVGNRPRSTMCADVIVANQLVASLVKLMAHT